MVYLSSYWYPKRRLDFAEYQSDGSGQLMKMLIIIEPHGIFKIFCLLYILTLSDH